MKDLKWIPKKYRERVYDLERQEGLIDDCKYILYFNQYWCWDDDYLSVPVRSKKEALEYIRNARKMTELMKKYEIIYYEEYITDSGYLHKGYKTIYTDDEEKAEWYRKNDKTAIVSLNYVKEMK